MASARKLRSRLCHAVAGVARGRAHAAQRGGSALDRRDAGERCLSFARNRGRHLLGRDCPHPMGLADLGQGRSILPHHCKERVVLGAQVIEGPAVGGNIRRVA